MNWREASNTELNKYDLPGNWLKIEYFEALNLLFRFENALRIFVYIILKDEYKDKWKDLSVTSDDEESSTINGIAKRRIAQDKNYAYLGYVLNSPLLHLTSGELIRIITSDSYWKLFKSYFLGTKDIMRNKLDEIGNVRNSVAHFRPIKKGDVDLIKQNSIHTLSEIEKTLIDLITCSNNVPSNTEDIWYKEFAVLGSENCTIIFKQSRDENWVKLSLQFEAQVINVTKYQSDYYRCSIFNLRTNNLIALYKDLAKNVIFVTESFPFCDIKTVDTAVIKKTIHLTFSKKTISKNYKVIKDDISQILLDISSELDLIKGDSLAKGKLIEVNGSTMFKRDRNDPFNYQDEFLRTKIDQDSPVEFWGTLNHGIHNFVTDVETYPWMPISISDDKEMPF